MKYSISKLLLRYRRNFQTIRVVTLQNVSHVSLLFRSSFRVWQPLKDHDKSPAHACLFDASAQYLSPCFMEVIVTRGEALQPLSESRQSPLLPLDYGIHDHF